MRTIKYIKYISCQQKTKNIVSIIEICYSILQIETWIVDVMIWQLSF